MTRQSVLKSAAAVLALAPLLAACNDTPLANSNAKRPVQVERVTYVPRNAARDFVGVVRARYETDLGFRVAGS